jgi:hypothetical protein
MNKLTPEFESIEFVRSQHYGVVEVVEVSVGGRHRGIELHRLNPAASSRRFENEAEVHRALSRGMVQWTERKVK